MRLIGHPPTPTVKFSLRLTSLLTILPSSDSFLVSAFYSTTQPCSSKVFFLVWPQLLGVHGFFLPSIHLEVLTLFFASYSIRGFFLTIPFLRLFGPPLLRHFPQGCVPVHTVRFLNDPLPLFSWYSHGNGGPTDPCNLTFPSLVTGIYSHFPFSRLYSLITPRHPWKASLWLLPSLGHEYIAPQTF